MTDEETIKEQAASQIEEIARLRNTIALIGNWTLKQDDTIWYDEITTLHDFCQQALGG